MSINAQPVPFIRLRGVTRSYRSPAGELRALDGVDVDLPRAAFVAVVGRSGSGKSTMLHVLAGLDHATAGTVEVDGVTVSSLGQDALSSWRGKNVGVVFQSFQLLPTLTIAENVALPMDLCGTRRPAEARRRALELLDLVGIRDQADKLPSALSGGQQQRAAIARALANDPPLVVADEPTGNLDEETARGVLALLVELTRAGRTVVMVTHDVRVTSLAGTVVRLADGKVVADA